MFQEVKNYNESILRQNLIFDLSHSIKNPYTLYVAHELGLFSLIDSQKTMTLEEICKEINIKPRSAQALLSMCTSCRLLNLQSDWKYKLTEAAEYYLLPKSLFYLGDLLNLIISNPETFSYEYFKEAILTGSPQVYKGEDLFGTHEQNKDLAKSFTKAMHSKSMASAFFWPKILNLSHYKHFLDIGGGSGAHSMSAVSAWPNLKATIYDRPLVCEVAQSFIKRSKLEESVRIFSGNMWEDAFPTADVHFYCDIFHDWSFEQCEFLAAKSYDALPEGGRIILHEVLFTDDKAGPFSAASFNMSMLLCTQQGQQFSRSEISNILEKNRFKEINILSTNFGDCSIVTGIK